MTNAEFIELLGDCAKKDAEASGILASVTIAQCILESGWGKSELAVNANNFFGMKTSLSGNTWDSVWDKVSKYTKKTKEHKPDGTEYEITADFRKYPDMLTSIKDHSCYLLGAMKGNSLRYKDLAGEKDYKKAIQIIKDGGYATDVNYVSKVCSIIESNNLTRFDDTTKEVDTMSFEIRKDISETSPCNKSGREIAVKGIMLHSVGCPQPSPEVFAKIWKTSTNACVHAVTGAEPYAILCLPTFPERKTARRGWHGASGKNGSVNNTHLSLEMTEPATIKYVGGASWVETGNGANTKNHVLATYANAVQLFAQWCKEFNLDPLADGVIISHHEGCLRGVASNHGDVEHIWNKFGLTMNQFRNDVKSAMQGVKIDTVPEAGVDTSSEDTSSQSVKEMNGTVTIIYKGNDGINVRTAPSITSKVSTVVKAGEVFTVVGISKDEKWYKLKSGLYITTIPQYVSFKATAEQKASTSGTGYFRVRKSWDKANTQIGAFKDKDNAIELCKQSSGYKVFDNDGKEIYPLVSNSSNKSFKFEVTVPDLRIRKGAGTTYDYHKKNGSAVYTGKGVFTIVKTKDGQGAKQWGLLKSYADKENGWIALDEAFGKRV